MGHTAKNKIGFTLQVSSFMLSVFFFAWFSVASAQEAPYNIMIAPHTLELKMAKGGRLEQRIKILNKGPIDIPIKAKVIDFTAEDETGKMLFNKSSDEVISPAKWITIKNSDFILSPGETKTLEFAVSIPKDAAEGGYYTAIIFEPLLPSHYFAKEKPRAIPEIGALVLLAVGMENMTRNGIGMSVAKFSIPEELHLKKLEDAFKNILGFPKPALASEKNRLAIVANGDLAFEIGIKNEDVFHGKYHGHLKIISDKTSAIVGETEVPKITIFPGKSRYFPVDFTPAKTGSIIKDFVGKYFMFGKYRAELALISEDFPGLASASGFKNRTEETIEFWIFPWKTAIAAIILFFVILLARKRITMAGRALFLKRET